MHTPPKSFHPIMAKIHTIGKKQNLGLCVPRNRNTKYKNERKIKKTTGIYTTRTIGDTNIGGGTYTEE